MPERIHLRALLAGIAARATSSVLKAWRVPGMPTVGLAFLRSGTANGDCGMVFERGNDSS
jgi:hypothetical protein